MGQGGEEEIDTQVLARQATSLEKNVAGRLFRELCELAMLRAFNVEHGHRPTFKNAAIIDYICMPLDNGRGG